MQILNYQTLTTLLLLSTISYAQEYSSYYDGKKVYYQSSTSQVLVTFKDAAALARRSKQSFSLKVEAMRSLPALPGASVLDLSPGQTPAKIKQFLSQLNSDTDVSQAYPVLLNQASKPFGSVTNQFIVHLKPSTSLPQFTKLLTQTGVTIHHQASFDDQTYVLRVDKAKGDVMALANFFYESGLFSSSEPDFVLFVKLDSNDPFYTQQWALNNTGQTGGTRGADMRVPDAWSVTSGVSSIRVAVIDVGVQLDHPDLVNNLLAGYDATGNNTNGGIGNSYDKHGTACAGIVAAQANNSIGVAGVAYSCRVVPVRIFASTDDYSNFISGTVEMMASGIRWAAQNNRADVLSMSWSTNVSQTVADAITYATTQGRNGLGCVVLASSANDSNSSISFPASLPAVIAVGATSYSDQRSYFSNYGAGLDVVAPGENIYTTDLQGADGYYKVSGTAGDYTNTFSGTSAACPNAAGVAALILSVNPNLTSDAVGQALEASTDKVGGYAYTAGAGENSSYTWNSEMGYGRVSAYNAVWRVSSINGPAQICSGGTVTYSVPNSGIKFNWVSTNTSVVTINSSTGVATAVGNGNTVILASGPGPNLTKSVTVGPIGPITGRYECASSSCSGTQSLPSSGPLSYQMDVPPGEYNIYVNAPAGTTGFLPWQGPQTSSVYWYYTSSGSARTAVHMVLNAYQSASFTLTTQGQLAGCNPGTLSFNFHAGGSSTYAASPNPASNQLTVTSDGANSAALQSTNASASAAPFTAVLFDTYGRQVKTKQSKNGKAVVDVLDLPDGLYNLRIDGANKPVMQHIQVTH